MTMTREDAIKYLIKPVATSTEIGEEKQKEFEAYSMAIEALTKPKGKWLSVEIIDDDSYNGVNEDAAECSVCRYVSESYYWAKTYYNFCPNCGARMKGDAE